MTIFIDIHAIHSVPPSNLNRDDTGAPKTGIFGGTTRHRVSSQAWKRVVREHFNSKADYASNTGVRTTDVAALVCAAISEIPGVDLESVNLDNVAKSVGFAIEKGKEEKGSENDEEEDVEAKDDAEVKDDAKASSSPDKQKPLFFASQEGIRALAELIYKTPKNLLSNKGLKKEGTEALNTGISADIALFGRMVAAKPTLNVEAAVQFSNALSTHAVETEFDYFTAIDETKDGGGAAMMGDIEFVSSTLYRYASVNYDTLRKNFSGDAPAQLLADFISAFVLTTPNGKQATFAARSLPEYVRVIIRDMPVNVASAFERAVEQSDEGYSERSIERLNRAIDRTDRMYDQSGHKEFVISLDEDSDTLADIVAGIKEHFGSVAPVSAPVAPASSTKKV